MIAKKYRLPIQNLPFKALKSTKTPYFLVKYFATQKTFSRFGIVISKKFDKKAVVRNLWKRRIFSILGKQLSESDRPKNMLLIVYPEMKKLSYQELEAEIKKLK
ncbi:ribonuclease P protein component [Patescibacteria group bacterium]|nr:ribonuclease P protein component [Patescibacteria group bacterium]